ncbi:twin-arginine translocation signal domain-containing protein [Streptomyces acidiscabies]|nr:twin-arginine translocation signal domain-containing protein [Streptomyces acidiscabies]
MPSWKGTTRRQALTGAAALGATSLTAPQAQAAPDDVLEYAARGRSASAP